MSQNFETWLASLGVVTKYALFFSVGLTAASSFGVVSPYYLILTPSALTGLQLWRPLSAAFFMGNFSFQWIMSITTLVSYLKYNEEYDFKERTADMVWMLTLLIGALTAASFFFTLPVISFALTMALCWVFCKRHPTLRLSLFSFEFNANVFPWALFAFHIIMGQGIMEDVCGIAAGHLYVFLHDVIPATHGQHFLKTPHWLKQLIPPGRRAFGSIHPEAHPAAGGFAPRQPQQPQQPQRHNWGTGRQLGAS